MEITKFVYIEKVIDVTRHSLAGQLQTPMFINDDTVPILFYSIIIIFSN